MSKVAITKQMKEKILIMDGAMGTMLQEAHLTADDFGGEDLEGCNEHLTLTRPELIQSIHEAYLSAGADIIETNTFGATRIVLEEYNIGHLSELLNRRAAEIAIKAAHKYDKPNHPRYVAGSMGPTTKTLSVTGGTTFKQLVLDYRTQAIGLIDGGVDLLLIETSQDLLNVKAAFLGIKEAFHHTKKELPIMISGTIEPMGTTLAGQNIEAFYISIEHMKPIAVGLNCATGPEFMQEHLRSLAQLSSTGVSCYPNAGLPDEDGCYHETAESLSTKLLDFAKQGWVNIVGGCCGTTPAHITAISQALAHVPPRPITKKRQHKLSGIEPLTYDESIRPIMVGERTNVIGSKKFKRLINEGKYEEASEIARAQVKKGASVIDICLADPDRNEIEDMDHFLAEVTKKIKVPLVIDSTDDEVIAKALTYSQGKAIINSINLEDGEDRFAFAAKLIHQYGAAIVVGTIDEEGMAITAENKLAIAKRAYHILVEQYQVPPEDIIFDPLVFPVGTGDEQYIGSAKETVLGIKLIKEALPEAKTILGISNVSFGLPSVGREILNSVFLFHCTKAGLDYAIVNTEKLERFPSIPKNEVELAEKLLFQTSDSILADFTDFYRDKKKEKRIETHLLSLEERLSSYIIEGTKEGLLPDLERALAKYPNPLDIINGPLMNGMAEVGRLFNDNQLIVAEVLQSAEVMKASVAFLEPYMENDKQTSTSKGKVLLATVKGDVHDIGKNLVDIILSNNGFETIDLGIKVSSADLIAAIREEKPDIIGLSGLLVKSAQQMALTAKDLQDAHIQTPIMVGGAALSRKFTNNKIAPNYQGLVLYAKDAMTGLSLANEIREPSRYSELFQAQISRAAKTNKEETQLIKKYSEPAVGVKTVQEAPIFQPQDLKRHLITNLSFHHIEPYINRKMLLYHLGVKNQKRELTNEKLDKVNNLLDSLIHEIIKNKWIQPKATYQFFKAKANGNDVIIMNKDELPIEEFAFPRQEKGKNLCLADYLREKQTDYVCFFAVTAGKGIRKAATQLKEEGRFLESHALQAIALETAEGLAEYIHRQIRDKWGFPDHPTMTMDERFAAKYQGQRFSFGYPACPNLEDQAKLFRLIQPEDIDIELTEGYMMEPEASVTAMVFSHPEARYFNVHSSS